MVTVVQVQENHNTEGKENQNLVLNERTMIQWLNLVWFSHVPSSSLLLADSFHSHTNSLTQKFMVTTYIWFFVGKYMFLAKWICLYLGGSTDCLLFQVNRGACLAIIPSACSHKLQPLHRGIIHKFKVSTVLFGWYLYSGKIFVFVKNSWKHTK